MWTAMIFAVLTMALVGDVAYSTTVVPTAYRYALPAQFDGLAAAEDGGGLEWVDGREHGPFFAVTHVLVAPLDVRPGIARC